MKQNLFDLIADQTDGIVKEALLGAALGLGGKLLRGVGRAGVYAAKNPVKALTAAGTAAGTAATVGFGGYDLANGTKRFTDLANKGVAHI